jgi:hypothetical protein
MRFNNHVDYYTFQRKEGRTELLEYVIEKERENTKYSVMTFS